MIRPPAIRRFEVLYLASTAAWLLGAALSWDDRRRLIAGKAALAGFEWLVPAGFALVLAVSLALWWGAAHRRSGFARAGVVVIAVMSAGLLVLTVIGLASGRALPLPATLLQLLSSGLGIAGAAMLFGEDARAWFGAAAQAELEP